MAHPYSGVFTNAEVVRLRARIDVLEAALALLINGFKYSTEVVTIAREALGGEVVKGRVFWMTDPEADAIKSPFVRQPHYNDLENRIRDLEAELAATNRHLVGARRAAALNVDGNHDRIATLEAQLKSRCDESDERGAEVMNLWDLMKAALPMVEKHEHGSGFAKAFKAAIRDQAALSGARTAAEPQSNWCSICGIEYDKECFCKPCPQCGEKQCMCEHAPTAQSQL
jgi:hypothetical protein